MLLFPFLSVDRSVAPPSPAAVDETMTRRERAKGSSGRQDDDGIGSSDDETVGSDTTKAESEDAAEAIEAEDEEDDDSTASPFEADSSPNAAGRRKVRMSLKSVFGGRVATIPDISVIYIILEYLVTVIML